jgi:hypothetical protein
MQLERLKCWLWTKKHQQLEPAFIIGCSIFFGLAFSLPILAHLSAISTRHDWDFHWELDWVSFFTVTHFHELPLWNPYRCGGLPMLANPQSRILTPFFLLHLLFGPFVGLHLEIPFHLAIGWSGGYVLARVQGLSRAACAVCGTIFAGSSWFPLHIAVGHIVFLSSLYLPWIVVFFWLGVMRRALFLSAISGLLVALTLGEGGVYTISQAFLLATVLACTLSLVQRSFWPIASLAAFAGFSAGFGAVKLLPTYEFMLLHPRPWMSPEATSLRILLYSLFSRNQDLSVRVIGGQWKFWEYGAYIGPFAAALASVGAASSLRRTAPWLVASLVFFALAMGEIGPHYPWSLLHRLPIFSSERVTARFLIPFTLTVGMLAGFGTDIIQKLSRLASRVILVTIMTAMTVDLWLVSVPILRYVVDGHLDPPNMVPQFRQLGEQPIRSSLALAMANQGIINCYEYTHIATNVLSFNRPGYYGEQYLLNRGSVRPDGWTPNSLSYEVDVPEPTMLIINQNYHPSWRLLEGRGEVSSWNGLLAVSVPAGSQRVTLKYHDCAIPLGAAISLITLLTALAMIPGTLAPALAHRVGVRSWQSQHSSGAQARGDPPDCRQLAPDGSEESPGKGPKGFMPWHR